MNLLAVTGRARGDLGSFFPRAARAFKARPRQLGYEITTGRSGAREIKGYTQEYLDASSPRSQQIREQPQSLFASQQFATAIYQSELT
jgi:hypothetical protein